jgi:hypothetical protein
MRCRNGVTLQEEVCAASLEPRYCGRGGGGERSQMKMGGGRENDYRNMIVNTEMLALHFERAQRRKIKLDEAWPSWRWLVKLDEAWPSWRWLVNEVVSIKKMYGRVSSGISEQYVRRFRCGWREQIIRGSAAAAAWESTAFPMCGQCAPHGISEQNSQNCFSVRRKGSFRLKGL